VSERSGFCALNERAMTGERRREANHTERRFGGAQRKEASAARERSNIYNERKRENPCDFSERFGLSALCLNLRALHGFDPHGAVYFAWFNASSSGVMMP
jgi:hypothetical protein